MCTLAAASSFNSPFVPRERMHTKLAHNHRTYSGSRFSDHIGLICVNNNFQEMTQYDQGDAEAFCTRTSLSATILKMTGEAKRQLYDVLTNHSNFPKAALLSYRVDPHSPDPNVDLFLSMLVYAYYPNIAHIEYIFINLIKTK